MIARAAAIAAFVAGAALPAGAQTALSTAGDVGSATLRGGYPAGGGAVALPTLPNAGGTTASGPTNATATTAARTGSSLGTSSSGVRSSARASTGGTSGGSHWVMCPPDGSSGVDPLFTGTDLSCAPH